MPSAEFDSLRRGLSSSAIARVLALALLAGMSLWALLLLTSSAKGVSASIASCSKTGELSYVEANYSGQRGEVWMAAANGSDRQRLIRAATPVIAPSGALVAVTKPGNGSGLEIVNACGTAIGRYFSSHDAVTGVAWSSDSSLLAAIVDPDPNGRDYFDQHLMVIDVATGKLTMVATGLISGWGTPSFSPTAPYSLAYALVPEVHTHTNIWSAPVGQPAKQLTRSGENTYPLWGPNGILFDHTGVGALPELELYSRGHSKKLMRLNGWPVALSSDGLHLAAEGAACGVVWPLSVNLETRTIVHQFANGYAPFGISGSGDSMLIAGSRPGAECSGTRSAIESVPFAGGKPRMIAYGTDPSWAEPKK